MSVVLLASGGIDSTVLATIYAEEGIEVWPLFIDYGQLAADAEWRACKRIFSRLELHPPSRMDLAGFGAMVPSGLTTDRLDINLDAFLPCRNLLFLVAAAAYAFQRNAASVAIGLLSPEQRLFPDQSIAFLHKAEKVIEECLGVPIQVVAPLAELGKAEVLALGNELGVAGTVSCHGAGPAPCGKCVSCRELSTAT